VDSREWTHLRGDARLHRVVEPEYPLRRDLQRALEQAFRDYVPASGRLVLADIGAGDKPWSDLVRPYTRLHIGIDRYRSPRTDLIGSGEALPVRNVDLILCTQMLEHAEDPKRYMHECYAALRPGGTVVLSTHGTFEFHPDPEDHWRFTHQGLHKLFDDAGFEVIALLACEGIATVATFYVTRLLTNALGQRPLTRKIAKVLVMLLNTAAQHFDRGPRPVYSSRYGLTRQGGEIAMNYVVVARRPGAAEGA
jgi:SAM-dependent methyltransferase